MRYVLLFIIVIFGSGCASKQAAINLDKASTSLGKYSSDQDDFANEQLRVELELRETIRKAIRAGEIAEFYDELDEYEPEIQLPDNVYFTPDEVLEIVKDSVKKEVRSAIEKYAGIENEDRERREKNIRIVNESREEYNKSTLNRGIAEEYIGSVKLFHTRALTYEDFEEEILNEALEYSEVFFGDGPAVEE